MFASAGLAPFHARAPDLDRGCVRFQTRNVTEVVDAAVPSTASELQGGA